MGRRNVARLVEDKNLYLDGDTGTLEDILSHMEVIVKFYPIHIDKEDKSFFVPCMEYFNSSERQRLLKEFAEFDRGLVHERATQTVEGFEKTFRNL